MELAKRAIRLNSPTQLAVTKLDVLYPESAGVREFDKLSADAKKFISDIEGELGLKVTLIGTGPEIYDVVDRRS
jgi:adenylosuccinate synthase